MDLERKLFKHFDSEYAKSIDCDVGWYGLISDLHYKLVKMDPDYTIFQIKEKFGGLRFYCSTEKENIRDEFMRTVAEYEKKSLSVCEITGLPGYLMQKLGWKKTLHDSFLSEGWRSARNF